MRAVVLIALLGGTAWLVAATRRDAPARSASDPPAIVGGSSRGAARPTRRDPARLAAVRFLAAFVRYEAGAPPRQWRSQLRRTASPAFASELGKHPPRVPARLPVARLVRVAVGRRTDRAATALARLDRGGRRSSLLLVLARDDGWRVAELGR